MEDRRHFLKIAGLFGLSLTARPVLNALAAEGAHGSQAATHRGEHALLAKQWAMVIDTRRFHSAEDLEPLIEVCHSIHNVPKLENKRHEIKWLWETEYKHAFPGLATEFAAEDVKHRPFLVLCNHCENPPCCRACPTKATFKRESDGIVIMDFHRCIGCRFCMAACPFGARSFNWGDPLKAPKALNPDFPTNPAYPRRSKGVVEKCTFCAERIAQGKIPACVEAANKVKKGALIFGDLEDRGSEIREILHSHYSIRRKPELGTGPNIYYII